MVYLCELDYARITSAVDAKPPHYTVCASTL